MKNNRKAINLLCSQFISEIGNWIDRVALLTLVYSVSKSNLQMSILSILILLPAVIFGIPFGKIIDLSNKKTILVFGDISRALLVILVHISPIMCFWLCLLYLLSPLFMKIQEIV